MIPLNRPIRGTHLTYSDSRIVEKLFPNHHIDVLYSSRDGLNSIYKHLYQQYGSIRIAVSPLTCFEAIYPIVLNGHTPVYIDINPLSLNIDTDKLIKRTDVKAVQIIYLGGNPIDIGAISSWAQNNGIIIIEDCAQALGSSYNNIQVGNFGDYAVISLVKNVYAPVGGIVLSKVKEGLIQDTLQVSKKTLIYKRIKHYLESYTSFNESLPCLLYETLLRYRESHESLPTDIVKTISRKYSTKVMKLFSASKSIERLRLDCAKDIISNIDSTKYFIQKELPKCKSNRNRIILISRNRPAQDIISDLREHGIAANNLTQSYLHPFQDNISCNKVLNQYYTERLPIYESIFPYIISIPISPSLSEKEVRRIVYFTNQLN